MLLQHEQYVAALHHSDESLTRFKSLKSPYHVAYAALQRADILWRLGRLDEADRELEGMFGPTPGMGKPTVVARTSPGHCVVPACCWPVTRISARAALARRALAALPAELPDVTRAGLQRALVLALARSGRAAEALSHLDELKATGTESTDPLPISRTALARSEVLFRLRRYEEALSAAGPLAEKFAAAERVRIRVDGRAAGGAGSDRPRPNHRCGALAGAGGCAARPLRCAIRSGRVADIRVEARREAVTVVVRSSAIPHGNVSQIRSDGHVDPYSRDGGNPGAGGRRHSSGRWGQQETGL